VLFDAGNTLIFLDYGRMAERVSAALSIPLTGQELASHAAVAARAMERPGSDRERAAAYLEALFQSAGVPAERMQEVRSVLVALHQELHLWCSVPDETRDALRRLRQSGFRLGVVSNSEGRVHEALDAAGLRQYFDAVVDSGVMGIEKPDPRIFRIALRELGVEPEEAVYVGDLYDIDVLGARSAGIEAVLLGSSDPARPCRTAASIKELVDTLLPGGSF
jgi:putative hydrolase of the HAD superfamily